MDTTKKPEQPNFSRRPTEERGDNVVDLRPEAADGQPVKAEAVAPAAPQGPVVVDELRITIYADGNCNITGPLDDRIKWHGMLALAADMEREMFHERRREVQEAARQRAHMLATETRIQRWNRERREKEQMLAVKRAAERAAKEAERVKQDELGKALAANATGGDTKPK